MIRQPTSAEDAYRWHRLSVLGVRQPVYEDEPQCGWFEYRRKGEPVQAACIWIESPTDENGELTDDEVMRCTVGDKYRDPVQVWTSVAKRPISKAAYEALRLIDAEVEAGLRKRTEGPFDPHTTISTPF